MEDILIANEPFVLIALQCQLFKTLVKRQHTFAMKLLSFQATFPSTVTRHDKGKEMDFPSGREVQRCLFGQSEASLATTTGQARMFSHNSTSPDILDFLDGVEHTQEHRCITPDPRLVSPPKKPTLDSLTPGKKFYPHKLY